MVGRKLPSITWHCHSPARQSCRRSSWPDLSWDLGTWGAAWWSRCHRPTQCSQATPAGLPAVWWRGSQCCTSGWSTTAPQISCSQWRPAHDKERHTPWEKNISNLTKEEKLYQAYMKCIYLFALSSSRNWSDFLSKFPNNLWIVHEFVINISNRWW